MKNQEQLCKWIQAVQDTQWKPFAFSRICSDHFKAKDYILRPGMKVHRLKANAVPYICKEQRSKKNHLKMDFVSPEGLTEVHKPADHTYSSLFNAVGVPSYKPDLIHLKKRVRTLQRQVQRQRHAIKKLSEKIAQLRSNKDMCSVFTLVA